SAAASTPARWAASCCARPPPACADSVPETTPSPIVQEPPRPRSSRNHPVRDSVASRPSLPRRGIGFPLLSGGGVARSAGVVWFSIARYHPIVQNHPVRDAVASRPSLPRRGIGSPLL